MPSEEQILAKISELKEAGYSYKEIGKQVDLSPMAVRSRWRRMTGTHLKRARSAKESRNQAWCDERQLPSHQNGSTSLWVLWGRF